MLAKVPPAAIPLHAALAPGRAAFNRGAYFEAHELWEDVWRTREGSERSFVQGLIQIAAGLHHLQQNRPRPAASLLRKGLEKVARGGIVPSARLRIRTLTRDVERLLAALDRPSRKMTAPGSPKL